MEMINEPRRTRRGEAGITLPETLVALVILAIVAVSILTMFAYAMELNVTGMDYATLTNRARDKSEQLLASPWYDSPAGTDILATDLVAGNHSEAQPESRLNITWRVTDFAIDQNNTVPPGSPSTINPNVKTIDVTAVSTSASGVGRRDVTLSVMKIKGQG